MLAWVYYAFLIWVAISPFLFFILWRRQVAFADSLATLTTNVNKLIAEGSPAAITAAVAAKDTADATAVDTLNATVVAALTPPPAA
jgi:hypothetical protein